MHHILVSLDPVRPGEFSTTPEELKYRGGNISDRMKYGIGVKVNQVHIFFWDVYYHLHLWNIRRVLTPLSFNQALDGKNIFFPFFVDRTWFSNQLARLEESRKHLCDRFNTELISVTVSPDLYLG